MAEEGWRQANERDLSCRKSLKTYAVGLAAAACRGSISEASGMCLQAVD